jgi:hypothetical protein
VPSLLAALSDFLQPAIRARPSRSVSKRFMMS